MSRLWFAMREAPLPVRAAYEALDEGQLQALSDVRGLDLGLETPPAWSPDTTDAADAGSLALAVGAEVRALDQALFACRRRNRRDDPRAFLGFGDEAAYILPRLKGSLPAGRRGQEFERRGLVYHRILPVQAAGVDIRLYPISVAGPGDRGEAADLVSALFARVDPEFTYDQEGSVVRVSGLVNEAELSERLREQLAELTSAPSMAAVWPELCLSPAMGSILREALGLLGLGDDARLPGLIVAGSWHEADDNGFVNAASVLGSDGARLLQVLKRERYQPTAGVLENIRAGTEAPVLMYGDVLIAFGICKDFCEDRHATPYGDLDVDLIIVPSLGDRATLEAHEAAAKRLGHVFGARSFVVQQNLPPRDGDGDDKGEVWGSVVKPPEKPRARAVPAGPQNKPLDRTRFSCTIS